MLGVLHDRDLSHLNLSYQIQVNANTISQHVDYINNIEKDLSLIETQQQIDYTMISLKFVAKNEAEKGLLLQKLKFFHTYQYYQMAGLEHNFMKKLLKWKFSFAGPLFENSIRCAWKKHRGFLTQRFKNSFELNYMLPEKEYRHYMYIVPIIND